MDLKWIAEGGVQAGKRTHFWGVNDGSTLLMSRVRLVAQVHHVLLKVSYIACSHASLTFPPLRGTEADRAVRIILLRGRNGHPYFQYPRPP